MLFNQEKALIAWNNDNLDTYHDIVVSFDYARYSTKNIPLGGFCVVFFESRQDVPTIGGPGSSLGYTPSTQSDYCFNRGYEGFRGGYMGIGFDLNGEFGIKTDIIDGLDFPIQNSCTVRGSESENYKRIDTSKNLSFTPINFTIADYINSSFNNNESNEIIDKDLKFKSIRVVISKAFTNIIVEGKNAEDRNFVKLFETKIPLKQRTAVRVGITHTNVDTYTKFKLKNFNVAGFPGVVLDPELRDCATITPANNIQGYTIVSSDDFCAVPADDNINIYEIRDGSFSLRQLIQEEAPVYLLGGNERFLFLNKKDSYDVFVYFKTGNTFLKTQTINLVDEVFDIPLQGTGLPIESIIGGYPTCADTDNKFLAIGNNKNVYLWQFFTGISTFGLFGYVQTLTNNLSGDIGYSVQIDSNKLLTGGGRSRLSGRVNSFVSYYNFNGLVWDEEPTQTFFSPTSGNIYNEFGNSISLQGNEAVIGSPGERRRLKDTLGHGEAYHYVFAINRRTNKREWRNVMALGNFFGLDTPGGNFGTSVSMLGNNLVISAPYENYHFPPDTTAEDNPNTGRVYIFRKNSGGTFSQSAIVSPNPFRVLKSNRRGYMYFGKYVGLLGRSAAIVGVPYNTSAFTADIDTYKIGCIFDLPPPHLPIRLDSIALYDSSGYTIDMETYTYLQLIEQQII